MTDESGCMLMVNIQHPGENAKPGGSSQNLWPGNKGYGRPDSATVVITRDDGGVIGI
jgi:hypothetical protein